MKTYRPLTPAEITQLQAQACQADNWHTITVAPTFTPEALHHVRFSGRIRLGSFHHHFTLPGGLPKPAGIRYATLHNVTIHDDCCIENIHNYIANYQIGPRTLIINTDTIRTEGVATFGNGVQAAVLNETGGREVPINDKLSAQLAYIIALYRHRPQLIQQLKESIARYTRRHTSRTGTIGANVTLLDTGTIHNVRIGDHTHIEGTSRLKNGTINSNAHAPVQIGHGVICDDFILSSGTHIDQGAQISRTFIGQACRIGHNYTASDSLFFSNSQGENGEACAVFAGPFTVTHHKSTLLIAGMFSFMNAGSGSNQSNHLYKLGPIHQGMLERGAKTTSDSYILWPARVGAFSLVMGRHVNHPDTTNLPFSYLIEQDNTTWIVPGVNLKSVGTIRDAQKWPRRDRRTDPRPLDQINYNLLSPYTVQKMIAGSILLNDLKQISGQTTQTYAFQSSKIRNQSLNNGLHYYQAAIHKFMGNSLIKRLEGIPFQNSQEIRRRLQPDTPVGQGEWIDLAGLIAPKSQIDHLLDDIETSRIDRPEEINRRFAHMHTTYYDWEWTWAYHKIKKIYGYDPETITPAQIMHIVQQWHTSVVCLDRLIYEDARKEFSMTFRTGFGADGSPKEKIEDFEQVRGDFENNPFIKAVIQHIHHKTALGNELMTRLKPLAAPPSPDN